MNEVRDAARTPRPSVDVVVVAYHSGDLLEHCLETVRRFVPPATRLTVVDNSPDDASAARAVASIPGAELIREPRNVGFAAAVNDAVAAGTGDYVMLVNPDVAEIDGSFSAIEEVFTRVEMAGAVAVHLRKAGGTLEHCRRFPRPGDFFAMAVGTEIARARLRRSPEPAMLEWDHENERDVESASGAFLFLRRRALDDVGLLDERFFMYFEETDWLLRARVRGWRLIFTPRVRAVHHGRSSSRGTNATHPVLFLESVYRFTKKWFGGPAALLLRFVWMFADLARLTIGLTKPESYRRAVRDRLKVHLGLTPRGAALAGRRR